MPDLIWEIDDQDGVFLTFDDGPWDTSTAAILDTLKEYDAKATFFTVGQKISGHEDLLQRAANEGHEIGTIRGIMLKAVAKA